MKRIGSRSVCVLVLALLICLGLGFLIARLWTRGQSWASYGANEHVYKNGALVGGTLTDRNGVVLASAKYGEYSYAEEEAVRFASLHTVGDHRVPRSPPMTGRPLPTAPPARGPRWP